MSPYLCKLFCSPANKALSFKKGKFDRRRRTTFIWLSRARQGSTIELSLNLIPFARKSVKALSVGSKLISANFIEPNCCVRTPIREGYCWATKRKNSSLVSLRPVISMNTLPGPWPGRQILVLVMVELFLSTVVVPGTSAGIFVLVACKSDLRFLVTTCTQD